MSSSKSRQSQRTTSTNTNRTETINAGIGGAIDDSFVSSGNYGDTEISSDSSSTEYNQEYDYSDRSDNSMDVDMEDHSNRSITDSSDHSFTDESDSSINWEDHSDRSFTDESDNSSSWEDHSDRSFTDESDNSMDIDMEDHSDRSMTDSSDRSVDNSVTNVTADGAFDLVQNLGNSVITFLGENQDDMYEFSEKVLASSDALANRSLSGAMNIKAGQAVTEPANQTVRELANTGKTLAVIAIGGYVVSKALKG